VPVEAVTLCLWAFSSSSAWQIGPKRQKRGVSRGSTFERQNVALK